MDHGCQNTPSSTYSKSELRTTQSNKYVFEGPELLNCITQSQKLESQLGGQVTFDVSVGLTARAYTVMVTFTENDGINTHTHIHTLSTHARSHTQTPNKPPAGDASDSEEEENDTVRKKKKKKKRGGGEQGAGEQRQAQPLTLELGSMFENLKVYTNMVAFLLSSCFDSILTLCYLTGPCRFKGQPRWWLPQGHRCSTRVPTARVQSKD